jgi:hypothetical protein
VNGEAGCPEIFLYSLFNANLQSTPPGAISKCGDRIDVRGEVIQ